MIGIQVSSRSAPADAPAPVAAATSTTAPQSAVASVKIDNFAFQPKLLVITAGTTVTWQNADDVPHTATSKDDPQVFDSGALDTDDKFSFTFSKPGKYAYYCKVHPHMTGVVIVK
jgi:plastocyanin